MSDPITITQQVKAGLWIIVFMFGVGPIIMLALAHIVMVIERISEKWKIILVFGALPLAAMAIALALP